jgi:hypothetical protein
MSRHPPRNGNHDSTRSLHAHGDAEAHAVVGRVLGLEEPGPHGAADLAVGVDEADGEGGARGVFGGLDAPGPH